MILGGLYELSHENSIIVNTIITVFNIFFLILGISMKIKRYDENYELNYFNHFLMLEDNGQLVKSKRIN